MRFDDPTAEFQGDLPQTRQISCGLLKNNKNTEFKNREDGPKRRASP